MREHKPFGKRQENRKNLPNDKVLQETFAVVNNGCDSRQAIDFIAKTTGHRIKEIKEKMNDLKGIIEDCNKSDLVSNKVIKKVIEIIGQEEWQDLYDENNDICTTMGELIITLKGITELEKENADLRRNEFNARSCLELQQSQDKAILNYMGEQVTIAKKK